MSARLSDLLLNFLFAYLLALMRERRCCTDICWAVCASVHVWLFAHVWWNEPSPSLSPSLPRLLQNNDFAGN